MNLVQYNPEGCAESSRRSERSEDLRSLVDVIRTLEGCKKLAPFQGAAFIPSLSGGLQTTGYYRSRRRRGREPLLTRGLLPRHVVARMLLSGRVASARCIGKTVAVGERIPL